MDLVFAYIAGVLTLVNPCVLPVLPITLAAAIQADRRGPVALALGMSLVFVILGVGLASIGPSIGITAESMSTVGSVLMIIFGSILLVPQFGNQFSAATAGLSASADQRIDMSTESGLKGPFLGGMLLGAVWSPCIGPTLGGAISMASQSTNFTWATAIMIGYAAGISTIIIGLGYGAREAIQSRQAALRFVAERAKPIMGLTFVAVGLAIFFKLHHMVEAWLLDIMPIWLQDLSVMV